MPSPQNRLIGTYFFLLFGVVEMILLRNLLVLDEQESIAHPLGILYALAAMLGYGALYLSPGYLLARLSRRGIAAITDGRATARLLNVLLVVTGWLTFLILYADSEIFTLYNYHFDGFVWNLITTPGGIQALGATPETKATFALIAAGWLILSAALLWLSHWLLEQRPRAVFATRLAPGLWAGLLLGLFATEELFYGVSSLFRKNEYTQASVAFPFFLHTSFKGIAKKLGISVEQSKLRVATGKIHYPAQPVTVAKPAQPLNVVWLVAESLRADMLSPEIMPSASALAEQSLRYDHHYSGGNRTRMGLLSMFYGLPAPYWFGVQQQKVSPVLMDVLLGQGYRMSVHTSQSFSYPELYDTVFAHVPRKQMHELNQGEAWRNDQRNIDDLLRFIGTDRAERPFFTFMFFESTHAPYHFPTDSIIRPDYLENMNYARLDVKHSAEKIKNRYINAAHFVDRQVGRVVAYLQEHELMERTLIVFTGDHGEEFMEKGHWGHGHNAAFPEEQIRVPMVLHIPGIPPKSVAAMSSHLDLPATLLPFFGVTFPAEQHSFGHNLLDTRFHREATVIGNYDYLTYLDEHYKLTFPFRNHADRVAVRTWNDGLVGAQEQAQVLKDYQPALTRLTAEANQFAHAAPAVVVSR